MIALHLPPISTPCYNFKKTFFLISYLFVLFVPYYALRYLTLIAAWHFEDVEPIFKNDCGGSEHQSQALNKAGNKRSQHGITDDFDNWLRLASTLNQSYSIFIWDFRKVQEKPDDESIEKYIEIVILLLVYNIYGT